MKQTRQINYMTRKKTRSGFTLTEIAIVLGIVGLILGAIWVAAAAVYHNMQLSKANNEFLVIAQNIRTFYANSMYMDKNADMVVFGGNQSGAALTYLEAGIFPNDMLVGNPPLQAVNPWGGQVAIDSDDQWVPFQYDSFGVKFDNVPQWACIAILVSNTGPGGDPMIAEASAGQAGTNPTDFASGRSQFPVSLSTAEAQCAWTYDSVGFDFMLSMPAPP